MLNRLISHNDKIPLTTSNLTRFHSRAPPSITIIEYLKRIYKYASSEKICLLILLIYIDRVCERNRTFTISSLTVHRFIITSICVSSKALSDSYCSNSFYAKVGGISTKELNTLELELLFLMDWRLVCDSEVLQRYYCNLVRGSQGYVREPARERIGSGNGGIFGGPANDSSPTLLISTDGRSITVPLVDTMSSSSGSATAGIPSATSGSPRPGHSTTKGTTNPGNEDIGFGIGLNGVSDFDTTKPIDTITANISRIHVRDSAMDSSSL